MNIETRKLTLADYEDLNESRQQAYNTLLGTDWSKAPISNQIDTENSSQVALF